MRLFQCYNMTVIRRFGSYIKVPRIKVEDYKVVRKPTDEQISLSKALFLKIKATGPVSVAEYMQTCLRNPSVGYYMQKDMIGRQGDFTTSPEISQLFGEIIAVWIFHEFKKIGSPKPWQIIELGPGRGTLITDILRTLNAFKGTEGLSVHLVEVSQQLASLQAQTLCNDAIGIGMVPQPTEKNTHYKSGMTDYNVPVYWYNTLKKVPKVFSVILANEFFDALPIHKFQKVEDGWREVLINSVTTENGQYKFDYVLSRNEPSPASLLIRKDETRDHVEISPESGVIAKEVADRLEEFGGFSLFIDYGHGGDKTDTFRAFKRHQLVDPLVSPGTADLTADVDFSFFKEIMKDKLLVYGPIEQGDFLRQMGIDVRLKMLLENNKGEVSEKLKKGYEMIVDKDKMGGRFKCFATFPLVLDEHLKRYPVAGFPC